MTSRRTGARYSCSGRCCATRARREATVWVETDRECLVEILGRQARTFEVAGHHYGLVVLDGLTPGSEQEYTVALDGIVRWPMAGSGLPPSVLRTLDAGRLARLAFGSCRVAEIAPRNLDRHARRYGAEGVDALAACAAALRDTPRDRWPDVLLMIGDQVYADEPGPATRQFIAERRGADARPAAARRRPGPRSVKQRTASQRRAARGDRRLRGVLRPVPGGLERPRGSLALLRHPDRDDLRRPRRAR